MTRLPYYEVHSFADPDVPFSGNPAGVCVMDAFPGDAVLEIHLAGHSVDPGGAALLIDSHDAPIAEPVWALYERLIRRIGPRPTLIERDDNLPPFIELLLERDRAQSLLQAQAEASP